MGVRPVPKKTNGLTGMFASLHLVMFMSFPCTHCDAKDELHAHPLIRVTSFIHIGSTTTVTMNTSPGTIHTTATRLFHWDEIEASRTSPKTTSKYIVINDKVYDIGGDFVAWHPGGNVVLSQLGQDATGM